MARPEAVVDLLLEQRRQHLLEERRELRIQLARPARHRLEHVPQHHLHVVVVEGLLARRELVEHEAQAVQIDAAVDVLPAKRLGGRVEQASRRTVPSG